MSDKLKSDEQRAIELFLSGENKHPLGSPERRAWWRAKRSGDSYRACLLDEFRLMTTEPVH